MRELVARLRKKKKKVTKIGTTKSEWMEYINKIGPIDLNGEKRKNAFLARYKCLHGKDDGLRRDFSQVGQNHVSSGRVLHLICFYERSQTTSMGARVKEFNWDVKTNLIELY